MRRIAPSLLAADFSDLRVELDKIGAADMLHLDVMDGHFVPNISFGPGLVSMIKPHSGLFFDVHMMVTDPERYIHDFVAAGADGITVHVEATNHVNRCIGMIREAGLKAAVALNPGTPLCVLDEIIADLDMVLLMTVNPGFGGQGFIQGSLDKIRRLRDIVRRRNPDCLIQVDGGINSETAGLVAEAGADVLVAGVAVFRAQDPGKAIEALRTP